MGYSMRFELTHVSMVFSFVSVYIEVTPPFPFLRVCLFSLFFTPPTASAFVTDEADVGLVNTITVATAEGLVRA